MADRGKPERLWIPIVVAIIAAGGVIVAAVIQSHTSRSPEVASAPHPAVDCRRPSQPGGASAVITFTNQSRRTIQLFWVDTSGIELPYQTVEPGQQGSNKTSVNHSWCVKDRDTGAVIAFTIATAVEQNVLIQ